MLEEATIRRGLARDAKAFADKGHVVYAYQLPYREWKSETVYSNYFDLPVSAAELTYLPEYLFSDGNEM